MASIIAFGAAGKEARPARPTTTALRGDHCSFIDTMRLVALARSYGFSSSVKDVLTHLRFSLRII